VKMVVGHKRRIMKYILAACAITLVLCSTSLAVNSNTNVIALAKIVRSCFPDLPAPWVASQGNGTIRKETSVQADATVEKLFKQKEQEVKFKGCVLKPEVADYTRNELGKMSSGVKDDSYKSDQIDGGRTVQNPVIHPDWIIILWVWQTEQKIAVSGIHKTMPITFSIKATKPELNLILEQIKKGTKELAQPTSAGDVAKSAAPEK